MRRVRGVVVALLLGGCGGRSYDGPIYTWSDDGACGVPAGFVGIDETVSDDGGCSAATWCPIDSSPTCVSPAAGLPGSLDGQAAEAAP